MSSSELNLGDQGMYIYEDSNFFGGFHIPHVTSMSINGLNTSGFEFHHVV